MKLTLTAEELLGQCKLIALLEPLEGECVTAREEGVNVDRLLELKLRARYIAMLDEGDPALCVARDITGQVSLDDAGCGTRVIELPADCRCVVEVKVSGWTRAVRPVRPDDPEARRRLRLAANPYLQECAMDPWALAEAGRIRVWGTGDARLERLVAVMEPPDGIYELDRRAIPRLAEAIIEKN